MVRRLVVFVLLGPAIGVLALLALIYANGWGFPAAGPLAMIVTWVYVTGALPAVATALMDGWLEQQRYVRGQRVLGAALIGCIAAVLVAAIARQDTVMMIVFGCIAAVAAAICSLLSSKAIGSERA